MTAPWAKFPVRNSMFLSSRSGFLKKESPSLQLLQRINEPLDAAVNSEASSCGLI
jgi:hypothetical protein